MARKCKTCCHPKVKQIDKAIVERHPYTRIASKFGVHYKSVEWHAKHHVLPIIDKANQAAERAITEKLLQYREEVNYSTLDKVKLLQEKILNDLDAVTDIAERVPLYRELRGSLQEQAKLCGEYQKDQDNLKDLENTVKTIRQYLHDFPNADKNAVIGHFVKTRPHLSASQIQEHFDRVQ